MGKGMSNIRGDDGQARGETSATWWIDNKDTADMML